MIKTNNNQSTTPTSITLRPQGIPTTSSNYEDDHFQVYVRKHFKQTLVPSTTHGYWRNKNNGRCYGTILNQYELTRNLNTLEPLDTPILDDMSAFEWVDDPNYKAPNIFFHEDNNLTDEEFKCIKHQLRESPLFKRMLVNRYRDAAASVDIVYITGSRLSGICDARSDIDIIIIVDDIKERFRDTDLLLVWKEKPTVNMHWYLRSWDDLVNDNKNGFINNTTGCYWNAFNNQLQSNILYANPASKEKISKYINNNDADNILRNHLFYKALAFCAASLHDFVRLNTIPEESYSKIWYHVCMYSLILQNKNPIDYKKQLLRAKRMRWNQVKQEDIDWMMEQIKWIVNWYDNFEDKWKEQAN